MSTTHDDQLTAEELQILQDFENGVYIRAPESETAELKASAHAYVENKSRSITLRISPHDLSRLKMRAAKRGMKYQTLLTALTRQFLDEEIEVKL
jgi:predicted DNA binding CopG/RHH family protein